jgi:hypothetical protein
LLTAPDWLCKRRGSVAASRAKKIAQEKRKESPEQPGANAATLTFCNISKHSCIGRAAAP